MKPHSSVEHVAASVAEERTGVLKTWKRRCRASSTKTDKSREDRMRRDNLDLTLLLLMMMLQLPLLPRLMLLLLPRRRYLALLAKMLMSRCLKRGLTRKTSRSLSCNICLANTSRILHAYITYLCGESIIWANMQGRFSIFTVKLECRSILHCRLRSSQKTFRINRTLQIRLSLPQRRLLLLL